MKKKEGYIGSSLAIQLALIPIILTFALIIIGQASDVIGQLNLGKDTQNLIYILIGFLGSLLLGLILGIIFSKATGSKPASAINRYGILLIPLLYALFFGLLAVGLSNGNYNSRWWGMYVLKNPLFFIFDVGLSFTGRPYIIPIAEIAGYSGFALGVLIEEIISRSSIRDKKSRDMRLGIIGLFILATLFMYGSAKDMIDNGIVELRYGKSTIGTELTEFDLQRIAPFIENNGLATLKDKASLRFMNPKDMPTLDGATAAFPVYGAFAQAVYEGLGDYYRENSMKDLGENKVNIYDAFVSSNIFPYDIIKCSKTSGAYERLINKEVDIIFVAEPSKKQLEAARAKGVELKTTQIGNEAFVFFTNRRNPVEKLTVKQIRDIYSGKITNWRSVGGENRKIVAYQRPEDSGSQTIMENQVMKNVKLQQPTRVTIAGGMGEMISQVAGYKNAKNSIGYSFLYYSSAMMKNNQIKYISVEGVSPTTDTIRSKEYAFTIPVYAVTLKSNSKKNVKKFLDWMQSPEAQELVEKTGYVSIK